MAQCVVGDVVTRLQIMRPVNHQTALESVAERGLANGAACHVLRRVEVHGVAREERRLTHVEDLSALHLHVARRDEDVSAEHGAVRFAVGDVTVNLQAPRQQTDLSVCEREKKTDNSVSLAQR